LVLPNLAEIQIIPTVSVISTQQRGDSCADDGDKRVMR
jgi:hypothetical protein